MTKQLITTEVKRRNKFKLFLTLSLLIVLVLSGIITFKIYQGYGLVQPEKYGIRFNETRVKVGVEIIPSHFQLSKTPVNTFFDYYNADGIYSAEFSSKRNVSSGLIRVRIDVDERNIGLIREYRYLKKENDTICQIINYYDRPPPAP